MPIDPEILPTTGVPPPPPLLQEPPRRIPNFGHTLLFFIISVAALILTTLAAYAVFTSLHLLGNETAEQLMREPRMLIPSMAFAYLVAGAIVWATFASLWEQPFLQALHWNFAAVQKRWLPLLGGGIALSLAVQFLSNFLPIPKSLPIDDFFRNRFDVWMVALFGTFVAPVFEELAFRGFLLPSLASTWDWLRGQKPQANDLEGVRSDPPWSLAALAASCALTSIAFAF